LAGRFVEDQSLPDVFAELVHQSLTAQEKIDALLGLLVVKPVPFGVLLEEEAVQLPQTSEAMGLAEVIALVFIANQLHPYKFNAVFLFVLCQVIGEISFPLFQLIPALLDLLLNFLNLTLNILVFPLLLNDFPDNLALMFILHLMGIDYLFVVFLLSNSFVTVEKDR
jgi:hypothetical protein